MTEKINEIIEKIDNGLFMAENNPMIPASIHLEGLIGILKEIKNDLEVRTNT